MTFRELYAACVRKGMSASLYQFDCGERVTITNHVGELFSTTKECGDSPNAIDFAADWLEQNGFLDASADSSK
jgi:hypothetical protein